MNSCQSRSTASRRMRLWGAYLCAGVLLMTTVAQALDSCESLPLRAAHHSYGEQSNQSTPTVCLICASAHNPSLAAPMTSVSAPARTLNACSIIWQSFHAALQMFALQVRPPPSL